MCRHSWSKCGKLHASLIHPKYGLPAADVVRLTTTVEAAPQNRTSKPLKNLLKHGSNMVEHCFSDPLLSFKHQHAKLFQIDSLRWFKETFRGNHGLSYKMYGFPDDFSIPGLINRNRMKHRFAKDISTHRPNCWGAMKSVGLLSPWKPKKTYGGALQTGQSLHVFSLLKRRRQHVEREMAHWLCFLLPAPVTRSAIHSPFSVQCCHRGLWFWTGSFCASHPLNPPSITTTLWIGWQVFL